MPRSQQRSKAVRAGTIPLPVKAFRSAAKEAEFLERLCEGNSVAGAAALANIGRQTIYEWRKDSGFEELVQEALTWGTDHLEQVLTQRARDGTSKKIFYKGKHVEYETEHHDVLAMFLMKARNRPRFADAQPKYLGGPDGNGPSTPAQITGGLPEEPGT